MGGDDPRYTQWASHSPKKTASARSWARMTFRYEWTATLEAGSWQAFTPASLQSNDGSLVESVQVTLPATILANTKLFVRIVSE